MSKLFLDNRWGFIQASTLHCEWNNLSKEVCTKVVDVHYHKKSSDALKCCLFHILVGHQLQLAVVVLGIDLESALAQYEISLVTKYGRLNGPKYVVEAWSSMQH